jgi:hypothetical protein
MIYEVITDATHEPVFAPERSHHCFNLYAICANLQLRILDLNEGFNIPRAEITHPSSHSEMSIPLQMVETGGYVTHHYVVGNLDFLNTV